MSPKSTKFYLALSAILFGISACVLLTGYGTMDRSFNGMRYAEQASGGSINLIEGAQDLDFTLEQTDGGNIKVVMPPDDEAYAVNLLANGGRLFGSGIITIGFVILGLSLLMLWQALIGRRLLIEQEQTPQWGGDYNLHRR
jgi:hypothetical protein